MASLYELEKRGDLASVIKIFHNSNNEKVRARALEIMGEIGGNEALKILVDVVVNGENETLKSSAAKAIAWSDEVAVRNLLEKIEGEKIEGASWVIVEYLLKMLRSEDKNLRMNAAIALGRIGNESDVGALIETLKDISPKVRSAAATALGMIGDDRAIEPLLTLLKDDNTKVRRAALEALNDLNINEKHIDVIKICLRDQDPRVRELTAILLGKDGEKALNPLLLGLKDEITEVRVSSVHSLLEMMSRTPPERSEEVRKTISEGLERYSETAYVVIEVLEKTESKAIRRNAMWLLGQLEDSRGIGTLTKILQTGTSEERRLAATSLVKIGSVGDLASKINHEDEEVRLLICWILGEVGDRSVKHVLERAQEDPSDRVRSMAFQANKKIERFKR